MSSSATQSPLLSVALSSASAGVPSAEAARPSVMLTSSLTPRARGTGERPGRPGAIPIAPWDGVSFSSDSRPGATPDARPGFLSPDAMWLHWKKVLRIGPAHGHGGGKLCHRCRSEVGAVARERLAEKVAERRAKNGKAR